MMKKGKEAEKKETQRKQKKRRREKNDRLAPHSSFVFSDMFVLLASSCALGGKASFAA